jgi:alkanesulfonate monooxygenase
MLAEGTVPPQQNAGSLRLLDAAAEQEVHDSCLWMALAVATGARGNSTALEGATMTRLGLVLAPT